MTSIETSFYFHVLALALLNIFSIDVVSFRNGPPAGLQAQLGSTQLNSVLMLALSIHVFTQTFLWWSISRHSNVQSVPGGGPTIDLHNFRKCVSRRSKYRLYIARCPPAKHATDDTTDAKYRKHLTMANFTFDACWRGYCMTNNSCYLVVALTHATYPKLTPLLRACRKPESHAIAKTHTQQQITLCTAHSAHPLTSPNLNKTKRSVL